jgi:hypothetical protein
MAGHTVRLMHNVCIPAHDFTDSIFFIRAVLTQALAGTAMFIAVTPDDDLTRQLHVQFRR